MASLRDLVWADGKTTTHQVRWRENGSERSMTFDDRKVAELYRLYLEAEGSAAADQWLDRQTITTIEQVTTLDAMMAHYIEHLTSVSDGTRANTPASTPAPTAPTRPESAHSPSTRSTATRCPGRPTPSSGAASPRSRSRTPAPS
jgi:hypothetical protein